MQDFVVKKPQTKRTKNLSPLSTQSLNLVFYTKQMIIWFLIIIPKIPVWGHVCRHSRIRTYHPPSQPEPSEMSQVLAQTGTQPALSNTAIFPFTLWIQEVLTSSTSYQMCIPSQMKTLWRTELTHRAEPVSESILRGSSELNCTA